MPDGPARAGTRPGSRCQSFRITAADRAREFGLPDRRARCPTNLPADSAPRLVDRQGEREIAVRLGLDLVEQEVRRRGHAGVCLQADIAAEPRLPVMRYVSSHGSRSRNTHESGQSIPHLIALSVFAGLIAKVPPPRTISSIAMCIRTRRCRNPAAVSMGFCGTRSDSTTAAARAETRAAPTTRHPRRDPRRSPRRNEWRRRTENGIHDGLSAGVLTSSPFSVREL